MGEDSMKKTILFTIITLFGFQGCLSDPEDYYEMDQKAERIIVETVDEDNLENSSDKCQDLIDNDEDDLVDCDDDDCLETTACSDPMVDEKIEDTPEECSDDVDNDGNNIIDCDEDNCMALTVCKKDDNSLNSPENTAQLCRDYVDNDNDGSVDCLDPECQNLIVCRGGDGSEALDDFPENVIVMELPGVVELEDFIDSAHCVTYNWSYNDANNHECTLTDLNHQRCLDMEELEGEDGNTIMLNQAGWLDDESKDSIVDRRAGVPSIAIEDQMDYYRADVNSDVEIVEAWDTKFPEGGNGLNYGIGNMYQSEQLSYAVEFKESGFYKVTLRAASPSGSAAISFRIYDVNYPDEIYGKFSFIVPSTWDRSSGMAHDDAWYVYTDIIAVTDTKIEAGLKIIGMTVNNGNYNVNYLEFENLGDTPDL